MARSPVQKFRNSFHTKKARSRSQSQAELVWGIHSVLEALRACPQAIREIIVDKNKSGQRLDEIIALAQKKGIPVSAVSGKSGTNTKKTKEFSEPDVSQGVSARIVVPLLPIEELLDKVKNTSASPLLLALDSIQDPHNLGAIIRSAVAAGANGIILPKDRSAAITGTVIKVSAGSVFHIDICVITNLVNCLKSLQDNGIWIFGTAKDGARSLYDTDLTVPACLVIGSEAKGLRPLVAEQCDLKISIPMQSALDSLNASVAAGIILFETVRQRMARHI